MTFNSTKKCESIKVSILSLFYLNLSHIYAPGTQLEVGHKITVRYGPAVIYIRLCNAYWCNFVVQSHTINLV